MSMNINLGISFNGGRREAFRGQEWFQTTTEETEFVLLGNPVGEITSWDTEWEGALQRLSEVIEKRCKGKRWGFLGVSKETLKAFREAANIAGVRCHIYGM